MPTLWPERTAADAAESALAAVRAFVSAIPDTYEGEPVGPEDVSVVIRDLITSLLHLADAAGVAGDREELAYVAYFRYRTEAAYERFAGFDSP